jgi:hypothetical protein
MCVDHFFPHRLKIEQAVLLKASPRPVILLGAVFSNESLSVVIE